MNSIALKTSLVALIMAAAPAAAFAQSQKVDFVKDIRPIFTQSCVKCHGLDAKHPRKHAAAKLRLDDRAAAFAGGRSGKVIIPGDAKDSILFKLLSGPVPRPAVDGMKDGKDIPAMPKAKRGQKWKPLSAEQIALVRQWIDQGANWPK